MNQETPRKSNKSRLFVALLALTAAFGWAAACSPDNSTTPDSGKVSSSSSSGGSPSSEGGGSSGGGLHDAGVSDGPTDGAALGLLVDNMTATKGTQIALQVPAGEVAGSYYTYSDVPQSNYLLMRSITTGTGELVDAPVTPPVTNPDGSQITNKICFGGQVVNYAGLGMNLVYVHQDAPADPSCPSGDPPGPFNASHYSGISFYINVDPSDAGPPPSIHFGMPDTQTGDPCVRPVPACAMADAGGCYDDFGAAELTFTPGTWTKVKLAWTDLTQGGWGQAFAGGLKTDQLIGMKWQVNGPGSDAAAESFNFCISDIYFTP